MCVGPNVWVLDWIEFSTEVTVPGLSEYRKATL